MLVHPGEAPVDAERLLVDRILENVVARDTLDDAPLPRHRVVDVKLVRHIKRGRGRAQRTAQESVQQPPDELLERVDESAQGYSRSAGNVKVAKRLRTRAA